MKSASAEWQTSVRNILINQVFLIAILAGAVYSIQHITAMWAVAVGGSIAITNVLSSYFWVRLANNVNQSPHLKTDVVFFYLGALQRFITTLLLFIMGFAWLNLPPLALLAGFGVAQIAYVLGLKQSYPQENRCESSSN